MKKVIFLVVLMTVFSQICLPQNDTMVYYKLRSIGLDSIKNLNYIGALKKFRDAGKFAKGIKKPDLEVLIEIAEDSIRNIIFKLKKSNRLAENERSYAERQKLKADSALNIANRIINAIYFYDDKFAIAYNGTKFGFIDKKGNKQIEYNYSNITPFNEYTGFAIGRRNRQYYLVDTTGKEFKLARNYSDLKKEIKAIQIFDTLGLKWNEFSKCESLEILFVNDNKLKIIPGKIENFKYLKVLGLFHNDLQRLPKEIGKLDSLEWISLYENEINELPLELFYLIKLKKLDLGNNQITNIPDEIGNLESLQQLDLSSNEILELPTGIFNLSRLKDLDLSGNFITIIPTEIERLGSLEQLRLNSNEISELPSEFFSLTGLKSLDLSRNQINKVPEKIGQFTLLEKLNLEENKIDTLPKEIFNLIKLIELNLDSNSLHNIPKGIDNLKELKWLGLANNHLNEIPDGITKLINLSVLNLHGNELKSLPENLNNLRNLTELDIDCNEFDTLSTKIGELKNLKKLLFDFPADGTIPQQILDLPNLNLNNYMDSCAKYGLYDLAKKIRISSLKKSSFEIDVFGSLSWYCIFAYDFEGAILAGELYRDKGGDYIGFLSNLAMGYLWNGRYQDAFDIYSRYKMEMESRLDGRLGKDIFLEDIAAVEDKKIKPTNDEDVQKIKSFLLK